MSEANHATGESRFNLRFRAPLTTCYISVTLAATMRVQKGGGVPRESVMVAGGAGFIGGWVIRHLLQSDDTFVVNVDKLTYAADRDAVDRAAAKFGHLRADGLTVVVAIAHRFVLSRCHAANGHCAVCRLNQMV